MSKNRIKATIVGGVVAAGLLAGAGVVYATSGPGSGDCGPAPSLSKATGPDGSSADSSSAGVTTGGPLCVAPVAPVAPISH